ncbi:MAG: hypothetical protein OQK11_08990 [Thiovulaceae bacterium]|nr:hypothetical protein [Sulfurimonadaceae bacterium]
MNKFKNIIFVFIIVFVITIGLILAIGFTFCKTTDKELDIIGNKSIKFILTTKDCGATTGYSTKIYMLKDGDDINFFTKPIIHMNTIYPVLTWIDENTLSIKVKDIDVYEFTSFNYIDKEKYRFILEYDE